MSLSHTGGFIWRCDLRGSVVAFGWGHSPHGEAATTLLLVDARSSWVNISSDLAM